MPKKSFWRSCASKRRYRNEGEARDMMHRAKVRGNRNADCLRPYECSVCEGWHLTSQEKMR